MFGKTKTKFYYNIIMKEKVEQEEIFSQILRAGRRTYFFDVRSTKADNYYLTVTESKKFTHDDSSFHYQKHKIYLYKEDFSEFKEMLKVATDFIINEKGNEVISERHQKNFKKEEVLVSERNEENNFTNNISFEDI